MKTYPAAFKPTLDGISDALKQICKLRNSQDIQDFKNLNGKFIMGRLTARVPSSSTDVITGDFVGDYCPTATFLYILINNSGTPAWRRITASSF